MRVVRRITIHGIADIANESIGTVHVATFWRSGRTLFEHAPSRCQVSAQLVIPEQKQYRVEVCEDLLQQARNDLTFMSRIITGDENWNYGYDEENKPQSSYWKSLHSPRQKKAGQVRSAYSSFSLAFIRLCTVDSSDRITHTTAFDTPVVEHWLEREIAQCHHEGSTRPPQCGYF